MTKVASIIIVLACIKISTRWSR